MRDAMYRQKRTHRLVLSAFHPRGPAGPYLGIVRHRYARPAVTPSDLDVNSVYKRIIRIITVQVLADGSCGGHDDGTTMRGIIAHVPMDANSEGRYGPIIWTVMVHVLNDVELMMKTFFWFDHVMIRYAILRCGADERSITMGF